jgi:oligosaccharide 4-alpha-D-glucosyltransferase
MVLLCFFCLFLVTTSWAQGKVKFWAVNDQVLKITWQPVGYYRGENITDAVILKKKAGNEKTLLIKKVGSSNTKVGQFDISIKEGQILINNLSIQQQIQLVDSGKYKGFRLQLQPGETIFGGGERALPLNRRGYKLALYNNPWYGYSNGAENLNFSVPFFTSSAGYGLFFDNASAGQADIGKTNSQHFDVVFESGELNVYIIAGKNPTSVLSGFHQLTGTQPLPPRWALGNFMSRFGYSSQQQVNAILDTMLAEKFPVDAVIFDLFWFGDSIKNTLGNLEWVNKHKWPNPKCMIGEFAKKDISTVLIAEPFILKGTRTYQQAIPYLATTQKGKPYELTNFYFGFGGILDIFRKDAGDWIWKNHYQRQLNNGVKAWWTDLGEPEKHPEDIYHNLSSQGFKRKFAANEVHNAFGHYWNKMLYSNYRQYLPVERLFHLNRSGFAGSQRYSIFPWSGDVSRSWSGLQAQPSLMLGMSMSGIPYIHADAGGFAGGEGDTELYTRWLQYAAFTPIFRPHGTALFGIDPNTFNFASEPALMPEPYRSYVRNAIRNRYALLPYNYTLAWKQTTKGEPLVAPLYYYYPLDTTALHIGDQFFWGESIMVAPVLEKAITERRTYLPPGIWYAFNHHLPIEGGSYINSNTNLASIPVYVKAGSIIPMEETVDIKNTTQLTGKDISLHYYCNEGLSQGEIFVDDGINANSIGEGRYKIINIQAKGTNNKYEFKCKTEGGDLNRQLLPSTLRFVLHGFDKQPTSILLNGKPLPLPMLNTDVTGNKTLSFTVPYSTNTFTITLQ